MSGGSPISCAPGTLARALRTAATSIRAQFSRRSPERGGEASEIALGKVSARLFGSFPTRSRGALRIAIRRLSAQLPGVSPESSGEAFGGLCREWDYRSRVACIPASGLRASNLVDARYLLLEDLQEENGGFTFFLKARANSFFQGGCNASS